MELERERIIEIVVAVFGVAVMLAAMVTIGSNYGGDDGGLTPTGGEMLVYAIGGFVVLMTVIGIGLAYVLNDPEDDADSDADAKSAV